MSPATYKLLKQIIRLVKGIVSALDKWVDEKGEGK